MAVYRNPNVLQPEGRVEEDAFAVVRKVTLTCPHCGCLGTFSNKMLAITYPKEVLTIEGPEIGQISMALSVRQCPNNQCNGFVMLNEHIESNQLTCYPPMTMSFDTEGLPDKLVRTLSEAIHCHSVGAYRAATMMVRRLLEEVCDDAGSIGPNLHTRLQALRSKITFPEDLFDAMGELKALGNDAAHIEAKEFAEIECEEAELSIELAKEILKARFQHKDLVERLRARKRPKT